MSVSNLRASRVAFPSPVDPPAWLEKAPATDRRPRARDLDPLALAARDGDEAAAGRLAELAGARLTRIALALGVPPDEVPDLVQDVLLRAWANLRRFDPAQGPFIAWLLPGLRGRARNRARARHRRWRLVDRLRSVLAGGEPPRGASHPGQRAIDARLTLSRLLRVLSERQREVVALYEIEGLSAREAARLLGMSEAGVRSVARDARSRLREEARRLAGREPGAAW